MTSVSGSCSQYWSRSLLLTSALLPSDTNVDTPRSRARARASSSIPMPPDCDAKPTRPRTGATGVNVAFMLTVGFVFTTPKQFGPTTRIPFRRATWTSAACASCSPSSANPLEIRIRPRSPFSAHSLITVSTAPAGTATTARSTGPAMALTLGCASKPSIEVGVRVHRVHRSRESTGKQVSQYRVTDRVGSTARSDHGDRARRQQLGDGARLGRVFTLGVRVEPVLGSARGRG